MNPLVRTWPHPAAPAQSQRCPESPNLLTNREKQALLLGMPFEIAEIAGGQSCDFTSLPIILTIWVLLSILFPAFPAFPFPLYLLAILAQDFGSRCLTEKMQRVSVGNAFRPSECMKYCDHTPGQTLVSTPSPSALNLQGSARSEQHTNSLTTLAPSTACFKIEE
jgi:hypothetical protein